VAAAEALPAELDGLADRIRVHFPWGSLLRGLLRPDPAVLAGLTRVMTADATLTVLLSSTDRDRGAGVAPVGREDLAALAGPWARHGLALTGVRPATPADVAAARSSWGRRLGAGAQRPAWLLEAHPGPALPATTVSSGRPATGGLAPGRGAARGGLGVGH
jgi:16S rRNA (adenine(1408)-N(1))-methyltransferase